MASSAGYGASLILAVNMLLARRIRRDSEEGSVASGRARVAVLAGGRFAVVVTLLALGHGLGLWLPAVAGGMLVAQVAAYGAGFRLLATVTGRQETDEGEQI